MLSLRLVDDDGKKVVTIRIRDRDRDGTLTLLAISDGSDGGDTWGSFLAAYRSGGFVIDYNNRQRVLHLMNEDRGRMLFALRIMTSEGSYTEVQFSAEGNASAEVYDAIKQITTLVQP